MNETFNTEWERLLADRLDGDIGPEQAARLQAMLDADENARREAADLLRVDLAIRAWAGRLPATDWSAFRAEVMTRVQAEAARRRKVFRVRRIISLTAPLAAAAALAFAVMYYRPGPRADRPEPVAGLSKPGAIHVAYNRPARPAPRAGAGSIRVTFERSAELGRKVAQEDETARNAPVVAVASTARGSIAPDVVRCLPPI